MAKSFAVLLEIFFNSLLTLTVGLQAFRVQEVLFARLVDSPINSKLSLRQGNMAGYYSYKIS